MRKEIKSMRQLDKIVAKAIVKKLGFFVLSSTVAFAKADAMEATERVRINGVSRFNPNQRSISPVLSLCPQREISESAFLKNKDEL